MERRRDALLSMLGLTSLSAKVWTYKQMGIIYRSLTTDSITLYVPKP